MGLNNVTCQARRGRSTSLSNPNNHAVALFQHIILDARVSAGSGRQDAARQWPSPAAVRNQLRPPTRSYCDAAAGNPCGEPLRSCG
eukprot:6887780-Alexandrium_andersonii.AAC.1